MLQKLWKLIEAKTCLIGCLLISTSVHSTMNGTADHVIPSQENNTQR